MPEVNKSPELKANLAKLKEILDVRYGVELDIRQTIAPMSTKNKITRIRVFGIRKEHKADFLEVLCKLSGLEKSKIERQGSGDDDCSFSDTMMSYLAITDPKAFEQKLRIALGMPVANSPEDAPPTEQTEEQEHAPAKQAKVYYSYKRDRNPLIEEVKAEEDTPHIIDEGSVYFEYNPNTKELLLDKTAFDEDGTPKFTAEDLIAACAALHNKIKFDKSELDSLASAFLEVRLEDIKTPSDIAAKVKSLQENINGVMEEIEKVSKVRYGVAQSEEVPSSIITQVRESCDRKTKSLQEQQAKYQKQAQLLIRISKAPEEITSYQFDIFSDDSPELQGLKSSLQDTIKEIKELALQDEIDPSAIMEKVASALKSIDENKDESLKEIRTYFEGMRDQLLKSYPELKVLPAPEPPIVPERPPAPPKGKKDPKKKATTVTIEGGGVQEKDLEDTSTLVITPNGADVRDKAKQGAVLSPAPVQPDAKKKPSALLSRNPQVQAAKDKQEEPLAERVSRINQVLAAYNARDNKFGPKIGSAEGKIVPLQQDKPNVFFNDTLSNTVKVNSDPPGSIAIENQNQVRCSGSGDEAIKGSILSYLALNCKNLEAVLTNGATPKGMDGKDLVLHINNPPGGECDPAYAEAIQKVARECFNFEKVKTPKMQEAEVREAQAKLKEGLKPPTPPTEKKDSVQQLQELEDVDTTSLQRPPPP